MEQLVQDRDFIYIQYQVFSSRKFFAIVLEFVTRSGKPVFSQLPIGAIQLVKGVWKKTEKPNIILLVNHNSLVGNKVFVFLWFQQDAALYSLYRLK